MKLRLVSFACVALALFCAPSRPVARSAHRVAGEFDSAPLRRGGFTADTPPVAGESSIAYFDTLAQFKARNWLPAGVTHVYVRAVTGTYPPPAGTDATPLWFKAASSATGIWGEVKVGRQIFDPVYSTNPVNIGEFGLVADGKWRSGGCNFTATSAGGETLSVSSTAGCAAGMRVTSVNWATRAAASLPIVPPGATITAIGSGKIAASRRIPAMNAAPLAAWWDDMTGTDNAPAIQAALNFAMQNPLAPCSGSPPVCARYLNRYPDVKFPHGTFFFNAMLNAGWGDTYTTLNIVGSGRADSGFGGTTLLFGQYNQPAINFEGNRHSSIKGLSLYGRNGNYAGVSQVGGVYLSPNKADWVAPEFSPSGAAGGVNQYAPMAGITTDVFCGSAPAIPYPTQTAPSWTGFTTQYNRGGGSSDIKFKELLIYGFGVDIAAGLGNCGNGDFSGFDNILVGYSAYGIAVVNGESRNVSVNNITSNTLLSVLTDSNFGPSAGTFQGPINNVSASSVYQPFDFESMVYGGPLVINNTYIEGSVRIGNFTNTLQYPNSVIFQGGLYYFAGVPQLPASYITNSGPVTFSGVTMYGSPRIGNWSIGGGSLKFENGGAWQCAYDPSPSASQILAINYSGGCLAGSPRFGANASGSANALDMVDPVTVSYITGGRVVSRPMWNVMSPHGGYARLPMTQAMRQYRDEAGGLWNAVLPPEPYFYWTDTTVVGTPAALTNDVLTFGICSRFQAASPVLPGDMIYDYTGTIFVVNSVGSPTANSSCGSPSTSVLVTARQQNNLNVTPGTNTFASNNITTKALGGSINAPAILINGPQVEIPTTLYYGDFTSGSATISGVSRGDGSGGGLASGFVAGDLFYGAGSVTRGACMVYGASGCVSWPIPIGGVTLSTVTPGNPGSIVMSAPARGTGTFPVFPLELRP